MVSCDGRAENTFLLGRTAGVNYQAVIVRNIDKSTHEFALPGLTIGASTHDFFRRSFREY